MSITHQDTFKLVSNSLSTISGSSSAVGNTEVTIDEALAANTTNGAITCALTVANLQSLIMLSDTDLTLKTNSTSTPGDTIFLRAGVPLLWLVGVNEVQTATMTGSPAGGTFTATIAYRGTTATATGQAYNISAATLQTNLAALANVGSGNVACAGGPFPGTPITVTFQGTLGSQSIPVLTFANGGLTGGSSPAAAAVITTGGGYFPNPFTANVTTLYATNGASATSLKCRFLSS